MVPDRQKVRTNGRTDGRTEWTDDAKTISLRLRLGIINADADISIGQDCLNFGLRLHLDPYFVYASSVGSSESIQFSKIQ